MSFLWYNWYGLTIIKMNDLQLVTRSIQAKISVVLEQIFEASVCYTLLETLEKFCKEKKSQYKETLVQLKTSSADFNPAGLTVYPTIKKEIVDRDAIRTISNLKQEIKEIEKATIEKGLFVEKISWTVKPSTKQKTTKTNKEVVAAKSFVNPLDQYFT